VIPDAIASFVLLIVICVGGWIFYLFRSVVRVHREQTEIERQRDQLSRALYKVKAGNYDQLTPEQRQLAQDHYRHQFETQGHDADKNQLEKLIELEGS
jgi:hypothetical protein